MKTYIKMSFSPDGASPKEVIKKMAEIGIKPVVGPFDFALDQKDGDAKQYLDKIAQIHEVLKGTDIRYEIVTEKR